MGDVGLAVAGTIPLILIAPDGLLERFPIRLNLSSLMPAKAGIQIAPRCWGFWVPAFAGTSGNRFNLIGTCSIIRGRDVCSHSAIVRLVQPACRTRTPSAKPSDELSHDRLRANAMRRGST